MESSKRTNDAVIAFRLPADVVVVIDRLAASVEFPTSRSEVARTLLLRALRARANRKNGVRAAG